VQNELKSKGLPWEKAKSFDGSAVIGEFISKKQFNSLENLSFELKNNAKTVQKGNTSAMMWNIDQLISYISQYFTLKIGDIIFTGTPEGVAVVKSDDVLEGYLESNKLFSIKIK
jgi:2-keto-4-pentenoate hydratase/2-oxohepta-3-ene-1,7-dioic acid hydratase in catechol pathway